MTRKLDLLLCATALLAGFLAFSVAADARGEGSGDVQDAMTMDLGFLQEKMLKIWIIEEASDRHNQRRIAEKSFSGMTPYEPTGDPEIDAQNREAYVKNDKHLRHYMLLELDGAIEVIDICRRVLGKQMTRKVTDADLKELLAKELPAIKWRNKSIDKAMEDLGRKVGVQTTFVGIASNEDVRIDLELDPGFTLRDALEYIISIHPLEYRYEGGKLHFKYHGADGE